MTELWYDHEINYIQVIHSLLIGFSHIEECLA